MRWLAWDTHFECGVVYVKTSAVFEERQHYGEEDLEFSEIIVEILVDMMSIHIRGRKSNASGL